MKQKFYLVLIVVLLFIPTLSSRAQAEVTVADSLVIDFWPDYDRGSVLVLLTGMLPAGTAVPATVTLPLPENAQLNAVAYMDEVNGLMLADYEQIGNQIIITTPNLDFRMEYYLPYEVNGRQHSFTFSWTSNMSVNQLEAKIQQPLAAENMLIEPAPMESATASDGFTYHLLPDQAIPAGQSFAINANYTMSSDALSINLLDSNTIDFQPLDTTETSSNATQTINWPIVAGAFGGILVIVALGLLYLGNRPAPRVHKPRPQRPVPPAQAGPRRFCHNCGNPIDAGDRFCRSCGTPVKGK